jgi:uncharacterized protein (TIRG00374 family)
VKPRRNIWGVGWRVGLCGLLLLWVFHSIFTHEGRRAAADWPQLTRTQQWQTAWTLGPRELWHTLRLVNPLAFALSTVLMGATIFLGVLRWRLVLRVQGLELPLVRTGEISLIAHFFNSFLLGSTGGDLMKAYYAARETHHKKTEAVTTVFADRLIGLFSMLLFACLMMLPNLALLFNHDRLAAIAWLVVAMWLACGLLVYLAFWGGLTKRWPAARTWFRTLPRGETLERSLESCRQFGQHGAFLARTAAISMALNALCVLQVMTLAWGLNLNISPLALFVIVPVIICVSALPITPSGLGVRENLFVLMLAVPEINVGETQALSLSLLAYAGSFIWSLIGGMVYVSVRESQHLAEVTDADASDNS